MNAPDKILINLLHSRPFPEVQNNLLRISDRELAISMLYMDEQGKEFLRSFLPELKNQRLRQEEDYVSRLNLRYGQYRTVIDSVILRVQGFSDNGIKSYVRPRR